MPNFVWFRLVYLNEGSPNIEITKHPDNGQKKNQVNQYQKVFNFARDELEEAIHQAISMINLKNKRQ